MRDGGNSLIRFDFVEVPYLVSVGFVLLAAFVSLESDLGLQAPVLLIGLAWAAHLVIGLTVLRVAVIGLSRWGATARWSDPLLLSAAGLVTSFALAPVYFAIDQGMLARGVPTDDDPLFHPAQWPLGILQEWTQLAGPVMFVTLLLGLPAWWARRKAAPGPSSEPHAAKTVAELPTEPPAPGLSVEPVPGEAKVARSCLQRLPQALGTDLIAARSELQYVRIYTTLGDALVLGALKDIAEQRAADGQLTHRTWWVSDRHVRTLRRRGPRYVITLSNGLEVPVSRRRQPALIQRFGASATLS